MKINLTPSCIFLSIISSFKLFTSSPFIGNSRKMPNTNTALRFVKKRRPKAFHVPNIPIKKCWGKIVPNNTLCKTLSSSSSPSIIVLMIIICDLCLCSRLMIVYFLMFVIIQWEFFYALAFQRKTHFQLGHFKHKLV